MKKNIIITLILVIMLAFTACSNSEDKAFSIEKFAMNTIITQKIYSENAKNIAEQVFNKFDDIEKNMTNKKENSEISIINKAAGDGKYYTINPETMFVIKKSIFFHDKTNGRFDICLSPLIDEWGVMTDHPKVPSQETIDRMLKLADINNLVLNEQNNSIMLKNKGMGIDLGGIGKGYAGDAALEIYKKNGVKSAFVNLGGNVVTLGSKPDGSPWKVGVQNPRAPIGQYIGILSVSNKAVISSGDYERYFEKDGKRYHHILDTLTGYPANSGIIGVTIVADKSIDGDGLSTSAFILGLEQGSKLVQDLGAGAVFITDKKEVFVTPNIRDIFEFSDDSKEYKYDKNW